MSPSVEHQADPALEGDASRVRTDDELEPRVGGELGVPVTEERGDLGELLDDDEPLELGASEQHRDQAPQPEPDDEGDRGELTLEQLEPRVNVARGRDDLTPDGELEPVGMTAKLDRAARGHKPGVRPAACTTTEPR